jgi:sulfonate transport system substrate-binding protein
VASYQRYYLSSTSFASARPDALGVIFDQLCETGRWVKANPEAAAELLKPIWGLDAKVIVKANNRRSYDVRPVTKDGLNEQQTIADAFYREQILPKPLDAKTAGIWRNAS